MELFVRSGRDPVHTTMMMIPQAWEKYPRRRSRRPRLLRVPPVLHEPWTARPRSPSPTDALPVPRWTATAFDPAATRSRHDGLVVVGSEVGLVDLDPEAVIETRQGRARRGAGRGPGRGQVIREPRREARGGGPSSATTTLGRRYMSALVPDPIRDAAGPAGDELVVRQRLFGYRFEDLRLVVEPMATTGMDAVEHGRRHAAPTARARPQSRLRVLPATLRPGDQPADRSAARGAW